MSTIKSNKIYVIILLSSFLTVSANSETINQDLSGDNSNIVNGNSAPVTINNYTIKEVKEIIKKNNFFKEKTQKSNCSGSSFHLRDLKHGKDYKFGHSFKNKTKDQEIKIIKVSSDFYEEFDFNGSSSRPNYSFTDEIKKLNYIIPKETSLKIVNSINDYSVKYYPPRVTSKIDGNILIAYQTHYLTRKTGTDKWSEKKIDISCVAYRIIPPVYQ